jgi:hypothetical protein
LKLSEPVSVKREIDIPTIIAITSASVEVIFAQKQMAINRLIEIIFFDLGCKVLFVKEVAMRTNSNGNREVSAKSREIVPCTETGCSR